MATELSPKQIEQVDKDLRRTYYLQAIEKNKLIVWLVAAVGALVGPALAVYLSAAKNAQDLVNTKIPQKTVDEFLANAEAAKNFADIIPPIGSIIAWHKNPNAKNDGTAPGKSMNLPNGWLECNGQLLPPDSPLVLVAKAKTLPDLNNYGSGGDDGRFLRGGTTSGKFQDDAIKKHQHGPENGQGNFMMQVDDLPDAVHVDGPADATYEFSGSDRTGDNLDGDHDETRPVNMSVVWIMRVK